MEDVVLLLIRYFCKERVPNCSLVVLPKVRKDFIYKLYYNL